MFLGVSRVGESVVGVRSGLGGWCRWCRLSLMRRWWWEEKRLLLRRKLGAWCFYTSGRLAGSLGWALLHRFCITVIVRVTRFARARATHQSNFSSYSQRRYGSFERM